MKHPIRATVALIVFLLPLAAIGPTGRAAAATSDEIKARLAALEQENAAIRQENAKIRRENAALRQHVGKPAATALPADTAFAAAPQPMAVKAPPPVATASWGGFYLGANAGYGVSHNGASQVFLDPGPPPGPVAAPQYGLGPAGGLAGGQIGFNFEPVSHWLLGVEADWDWTNQSDSACLLGCTPTSASLIDTQQLQWLATTRGRIGYDYAGWLLYATGGGAFGRVTESETLVTNPPPTFGSFAHTQAGWTAGAGLETALGGHWSAKLEYLYIDLGNTTDVLSTSGFPTLTATRQVRDHVVRVGLNYLTGGGEPGAGANAYGPAPAAMFAKAPAAQRGFDWSGFYLGGNIGYSVARDRASDQLQTVTPPVVVGANESFTLGPNGWLSGSQIGYNWQPARNWLIGVEADWQWTAQTDSICVFFCVVNPNVVFSPRNLTIDEDLSWFATARARLGYADYGWLWYVTGGPALGRATENDSLTLISGGGLGSVTSAASFKHTNGGWTAGAGVEAALPGFWSNWSAKVEYLYVDLGGASDTFQTTTLPTLLHLGPNPPIVVAATVQRRIRDNVFRFGLNYHFGAVTMQ